MKILPLQKEMVRANKSVVICANARGVGHTTGLLFKVLELYRNYTRREDSGLEVITFLSPTYNECKDSISKMVELCEAFEVEYQYLKRDGSIFLGEHNFRVHFEADVDDTLPLKPDYLMVERPHLFAEDIKRLLTRNYKQVFFTTTPYECGWRNPQLEHGDIILDKHGSMVCEKESWDSFLIDWKPLHTRAEPSDYKDFVQVITGYGYEDNINLSGSFDEAFGRMNPHDQHRLNGVWKEGLDLC